MKPRCHAILASRFAFERTTEDSPVSDVAASVAEAMVAEMTVHVAANIIELLALTLVTLQTIPFLESGLETYACG